MKFIKVIWFGTIGLVIGADKVTKERKAYIGQGSGLDETFDIEHIMKHGTKVNPEVISEVYLALC